MDPLFYQRLNMLNNEFINELDSLIIFINTQWNVYKKPVNSCSSDNNNENSGLIKIEYINNINNNNKNISISFSNTALSKTNSDISIENEEKVNEIKASKNKAKESCKNKLVDVDNLGCLRSNNIRKEIKTHLSAYIFDRITSMFENKSQKCRLMNFPRSFNVTVNHYLCKEHMKMKVKDIFTMQTIDKNQDNKRNHNIRIIQNLINPLIIDNLDRTLADWFKEYSTSDEAKLNKKKLLNLKGNLYIEKYEKIFEEFLQFYS